MIARQLFKRGDRLRLSWKGLQHFRRTKVLNASTLATVVGFGRDPAIVKVVRDGTRTIQAFEAKWWEVSPQLELPGTSMSAPSNTRESRGQGEVQDPGASQAATGSATRQA